MALERKWLTILPVPFTSNGTQFGVVTVADTLNFKDKQVVVLQSDSLQQTRFQVKQVLSNTQLIVGPVNNSVNPTDFSNISAFTLSDHSTIQAAEQDKLAQPTDKDHYFAIYESSPVNADRVIPVDPYGNLIGVDNPLPVAFDGTVSIGDVHILGPSPTNNELVVNADGSINVVIESIPSSSTIVKSIYNETIVLGSGGTAFITTYTVPASTQSVLQKVSFSGENIGRFDLLINSIVRDTGRTMFGANLTGGFDWTSGGDSGFILNTGDIIKIQVTNPRPSSANYEARIQVLEIPI